MKAITLEIPEDIARHLRVPRKGARELLLEELALRLFEDGIMTAAQGARLLKMQRWEFERVLARNEIPFHGDADELKQDVANIRSVVTEHACD